MRLIDADALKKQIEDFHCKNCDNYNFVRCRACHIDDAISYLDEAPTVDGWISVKDRLPEDENAYLAVDNERRVVIARYKSAGNCSVDWPIMTFFPQITHWMPLPEPPEVVKDGDDRMVPENDER